MAIGTMKRGLAPAIVSGAAFQGDMEIVPLPCGTDSHRTDSGQERIAQKLFTPRRV